MEEEEEGGSRSSRKSGGVEQRLDTREEEESPGTLKPKKSNKEWTRHFPAVLDVRRTNPQDMHCIFMMFFNSHPIPHIQS